MNRRVLARWAALATTGAVAVLGVIPAVASAKSGLACLTGTWTSGTVSTSQVSGLSGAKLTIKNNGAATLRLAGSSPLVFTGSDFLFQVTGSTSGRFSYKKKAYSYKLMQNHENLGVYNNGAQISSQQASSTEVPRFGHLRCTSSTLSSTLSVTTAKGKKVSGTWKFTRS